MKRREDGFTIIELMIATTVVSVILLLTSIIMINIGNLYYKGISQARIQGNARSITDELAQHLKLTSATPIDLPSVPTGKIRMLCVGDTSYTYVIGKQINGTGTYSSKHVLWRDKISAGDCEAPDDNFLNVGPFLSSGTELIAPKSRLSKFSVDVAAQPYKITVDIAYGDDDLLCSPGTPSNTCANPNAGLTAAEAIAGDLKCKGKQSDSFCATANLTTTAVRRLY